MPPNKGARSHIAARPFLVVAISLADHPHARDDDRVLRLRVVSSSEPALVGVTFAIKQDSVRIGRGPDNDIVVDDSGLSRHHAILERTPSGWKLRDTGSANGLWVGEARVGSVVLAPVPRDGDARRRA